MPLEDSREKRLLRILTFRDLYLLIVGAVIGSGIFLIPSTVLQRSNGFVGLALLIWLSGGILSLLGALTYGELSARRPLAGGLYIYIRDAFGEIPAFLYGWSLFFVIANGAVATLAVAFPSYLNEIIPINGSTRKGIAVLVIGVVAAVNVRGTRHSSNLQNWTTAIKILAILVMTSILIFRGSSSFDPYWPASWQEVQISGIGVATIGVLWAYEGWQFATFSAAEIVDPQRSYPRAFLFGMLTLIFLYIVTNIGYVAALGASGAASSESIAATSLAAVVGPWAGKIVAGAILISIFSAANSILLTSSRVFYAMARDRLFFPNLAKIHPKFQTPAISVIVGSLWATFLALTGTFQQLLTYVVFTGWIFYGLGAASLFVYRQRKIGNDALYRVPGYPVTPLLFIISGLALVFNTLMAQTREAMFGVLIVSSGIPAYFFWRRHSKSLKDARTSGDVVS